MSTTRRTIGSSSKLSTDPTIQSASVSAEESGFELNPDYVRSELTLHWLFLLMAAIIILLSFLMRSEGEKSVFLPGFASAMPETCSAQRLFGIDCPGCGMTRAFISISSAQFSRAWNFNPASFIVYFFVAVQIPWHTFQIWRLTARRQPLVTAWAYMAPIGVVVILTINWIWKISTELGS